MEGRPSSFSIRAADMAGAPYIPIQRRCATPPAFGDLLAVKRDCMAEEGREWTKFAANGIL